MSTAFVACMTYETNLCGVLCNLYITYIVYIFTGEIFAKPSYHNLCCRNFSSSPIRTVMFTTTSMYVFTGGEIGENFPLQKICGIIVYV